MTLRSMLQVGAFAIAGFVLSRSVAYGRAEKLAATGVRGENRAHGPRRARPSSDHREREFGASASLHRAALQASASVVLLRRPPGPGDDPRPASNATGFVIANPVDPHERLILSNAHPFVTMVPGERVLVGFAGNECPVEVEEILISPIPDLLDLCVLKARLPSALRPLPLASGSKDALNVAAVGHPFGGLGPGTNTGQRPAVIVGPIAERGGDYTYAQYVSVPGMSGAPVIDARGRVVGIHTVGVGLPDQSTVFAGFSPVEEWSGLLSGLAGRTLELVHTGIAAFSSTPLERVLALRDRGLQAVLPDSVTLSAIDPGSLAERAGLAVGDVIVATRAPGNHLGPWEPASYARLRAALLRLQPGAGAWDLRVAREDEHMMDVRLDLAAAPHAAPTGSPADEAVSDLGGQPSTSAAPPLPAPGEAVTTPAWTGSPPATPAI